jgi:Do/DeqQ family serine protease
MQARRVRPRRPDGAAPARLRDARGAKSTEPDRRNPAPGRRTRASLTLAVAVVAGACLPGAAPPAAFGAAEQVPRSRAEITLSFAPVVRKAAPAVVNIYTQKQVPQAALNPFAADPFFRYFFQQFGGRELPTQPEKSLGSGVIVRADGLIVTNYHVVEDADEIMVVTADRREFRAHLVGGDQAADLALLGIDADRLPALPMGDSDALEVGDLVLAIGDPFGIGQTVTSGIVSALARTAPGTDADLSFIQTDAAINPGNSGGALVTLDGALVGINTAIFTQSGGSVGIGFAIPVDLVKALIRSVDAGGKGLARAWLGATVQPVDADLARSLGLGRPEGVLVDLVYPGGPAARAGIVKGDVILAVDGRPVEDPKALNFRLAIGALGKDARLDLWRQGRKASVGLPLETPPYRPAPQPTTFTGRQALAGATVANLSPGLDKDLNLDLFERGVVVLKVAEASPAAELGLEPGDLVTAVAGRPVGSVEQLTESLRKARPPWRLEIERAGEPLAVVIGG